MMRRRQNITRRRRQAVIVENITLQQAYIQFMEDKKAENLSSATLATYKIHIENFIDFTDMANFTTALVGKDIYDYWIEDLQNDQNKKDITVASYCRSVRAFLYWMIDNHYIEDDDYKVPRYQKTIKVCYTDDELRVLLKKPAHCSEVEYQSWVFINLICSTGLRLSSALALKVSDFDFTQHIVYIQKTKNNRAQVLYLSDELLTIIKKYIALFELEVDSYLFCSAEGTVLNKRTMQQNIANYNNKHGVEKTSIHLFRHTFAKNYYNKTKDIYSLSHILDHSSIATTEKYLTDLGVSLADATAYNPQLLYAENNKRKRRKRVIE